MITRNRFPKIHYYDQDFVSLYQKSWNWTMESIVKNSNDNSLMPTFFNHKTQKIINQVSACFSTFFLVYSNGHCSPTDVLDNFYSKQEANGAIRGIYSLETGKPIIQEENPELIMPPLFAWAEYNIYHKVGNKKRLEEIIKPLENYYDWVESLFLEPNNLYHVPSSSLTMSNSPRIKEVYYPIDFNAQQAISALYISRIAETLNEKDLSLKFKKKYFSLKANVNSQMWDKEDGFYYDLNKKGEFVKVRTLASYWTLLAEFLNEDKVDSMVHYLRDDKEFGTRHPFPSLTQSHPEFSEEGKGYLGSVFPHLVFMVVKGLEKVGHFEFARECVLRHLYSVLDTLNPEGDKKGALYCAYAPNKDSPAYWEGKDDFPVPFYMPYCALSIITMMIENVVGLHVSIPRKTVTWIVTSMEVMGIENLSLKRNFISILSQKSGRGWEIRLESEKLYYFTINVIGKKEKTLPIPSGRCSMLLEKI